MGLVEDLKIGSDVNPRVRDMLRNMADILNGDGYQRKIYANAPTVSDSGFDGEKRHVVTGSVLRLYLYANKQWWKSDATQTSGWSAVT